MFHLATPFSFYKKSWEYLVQQLPKQSNFWENKLKDINLYSYYGILLDTKLLTRWLPKRVWRKSVQLQTFINIYWSPDKLFPRVYFYCLPVGIFPKISNGKETQGSVFSSKSVNNVSGCFCGWEDSGWSSQRALFNVHGL